MKQSQYYLHNAFWHLAGLLSFYLLSATVPAVAVVSDTQITDVTTRAFSAVWVSSEQVTSATVQVFSDAGGSNDITATLNVTLVSPQSALLQGIAKVDVAGLAPATTAYVRTVTIGPSGQVVSSNLLPVRTARESTKANSSNQPIINDLILDKIFLPDGVNPAEGALLLVKAPKISSYPLTAFVGQGFTAPAAVIDLNNLFNDATGLSAEVPAGAVLEVTEFRGLHCNQNQKLAHMRLAPSHEETPPITELELPAKCFSPNNVAADFNCDKSIDPGDFNLFLSSFGTSIPTCRFNSDYDLNADKTIGPGDFNLFLSVFGRKG